MAGAGLCAALLLVACSQGRDRDQQDGARADIGAAAAAKPPPFDKGPVKIALVQYSGAGDYFELWTKGATAQADAVDHGRSPTLCPLINQATDAGIAVVVYDVKVADCAPKAVETAQNDADLATLVLTQMAQDIGDRVPVGYVNPFVIAPLERRDVVWKKFVADHRWDQKFLVGKFSHAVAADNARLAAGASRPHPGVKAVFAPYDELTKGTLTAIEQNKLGSKVAAYGIDISNADIELMTKKDSPWKATATTDPSAVGAAVTRTLALQLAGQLGSRQVVFHGVLVTQSFLLKEQIKTMDDLRAKLPELNLTNVASAAWIR
jgi:simple sugar transport system substrate-binding protein